VVVDGLRQGLRELGLEEGKHLVLDIREIDGDPKAAEEAARDLERGKVDLIYTVNSQVTIAASRATVRTPIVFYVGADPVALRLGESLAKPGGRLTGVHGLSRDVTAKRLAVLKEMIPKLRRVVTFYNPGEPVSQEYARLGRDAARQLGVQVVERHVGSIEELRLNLQALKSREVDAYFHTPGSLETSQALLIIEATRGKKLPTMFHEQSLVAKGALASYGMDYQEIGRLSAKHVQRILAGSHPKDLPVENYDKVGFALNLRIAREIGLTIPQSLRLQANQIIE
jgi:putative ABC transport system substrate-binding protein